MLIKVRLSSGKFHLDQIKVCLVIEGEEGLELDLEGGLLLGL